MKLLFRLLYVLLLIRLGTTQSKQSCNSLIYCQGDLLHAVQTSKIFNDSKTFVDLSLVHPMNVTLKNFKTFVMETHGNASREQISQFVSTHFKSVGELEEYLPLDFRKEPKILKDITDPVVQKFAKKIIEIWPSLCRKVSPHVFEHPETHSIIPVDKHFIIPGGRFKEYYYWDSYWIIKGLLLSDMVVTAKGMVENILSVADRFGFVPNGGRIYYLNRSQPPLLTLMVSDYVKYSKDFEFLGNNIKILDKELKWWMQNRLKTVEKLGRPYRLFHYDSESDTPRPESYLEDVETCSTSENQEGDKVYECYTDLKSGAESGWDYTSRWFFGKQGEPVADIHQIHTRRNIPVDLNSFIYKCFVTMKKFYMILANDEAAKYWLDLGEELKESIENVLYDEGDGIWYDFDRRLGKPRKYFFASNLVPLWAEAMDESVKSIRGGKAVEYLVKNKVAYLKGGVPSSLFATGQQWDYPNAWSPYQNLIIIGLEKSGNETAQILAKSLAHNWVSSNIKAFHENKVMFEKYNAQNSGQFGSGGEYHIQAGFGWSNGCVLELIHLYFRMKRRKYKDYFET